MSEASYQENVNRGVTGPWSSTCLMAAYDRFSLRTGISTETYEAYEQTRRDFAVHVGDDNNFVAQEFRSRFAEIKERFRAELGVYTKKNIFEARINTKDELVSTIGKLSIGGFRTALYLDLGGLHAVGVKANGDEQYDARSTWTPFCADEPITADMLYDNLDLAPRQRTREGNCRKTQPAFNIIALPSEAR